MTDQLNSQVIENLSSDIRYIKENMVTYREYDHLHNEFHVTKAVVDNIVKEQDKREWMVKLGERAIWLILGAVLVAVLKMIDLEVPFG